MPQSLAKILVHTVFSTKERRPFLRDETLREEVHRYIGGILVNLDCQPVIVGGVEDHVHLLCALSRTYNAAESGQLGLKLRPVPTARAYEVQVRYGANGWEAVGVFTDSRKIVIPNLTPGTVYTVQSRAIGGTTGYSDWSDPVSRMAM